MDNSHDQPARAPWLPSRGFWLWALVTIVSFLLIYFFIEPLLWAMGWYTFAVLYRGDPQGISRADQVHDLQIQALLACIPSLIFALALIGFAAWRRKLAYIVGPLLGLLLGIQHEYDIKWHTYFGGEALGPGLQLADHTAHSMFAGLCVFVALAAR